MSRKKISILGASGACGRAFLARLLNSQCLPSISEIQLGGRAGQSQGALNGLIEDLSDGLSGPLPALEVVPLEHCNGDIIVIMAGETMATNSRNANWTRKDLAHINRDLIGGLFSSIAPSLKSDAIVIVVTNPVETIVRTIGTMWPRQQILSMGAQLDSIRLRRDIAEIVACNIDDIQLYVGGEHGSGVVPLWSTLKFNAPLSAEQANRTKYIDVRNCRRRVSLCANRPIQKSSELLRQSITSALQFFAGDPAHIDYAKAQAAINRLSADVRANTRSIFMHKSGGRTAWGTARATMNVLESVLGYQNLPISGQVELQGEHGLYGVTGVPLMLSPKGWTIWDGWKPTDFELTQLQDSATESESIFQNAASL
jgi:malate dehydrogenase